MRHWKLIPSLLVLLAASSIIAVAALSYTLVKSRHLDELHRSLASRAELYAVTIGGALDKYEFLPLAVAQNKDVADLLEHSDGTGVAHMNVYLEDITKRAGAFALYVLDTQGTVLASSNWNQPTSYVGQNYAFRPYFKQAVSGAIGRFYGIGVSTREAGYFIAQPIRRDGRILGIVAAKVSLDWLEQSWRNPGGDEQIWVKDANRVILMSSNPAFKFKTLATLSVNARESINAQQQFLQESLPKLPHKVLEEFSDGAALLSLERGTGGSSGDFLAVSRRIDPLDWQITVLAELEQVRAAARNAAAAAALGWALVLLALLYARQRRRRIDDRLKAQHALKNAYDDLERKVEQRTIDLQEMNHKLHAEVAEREKAEQTLRYAQAELIQSGKLAAIGQMAAGVTHELNQPLAALQTFSDNARVFIARGRTEDALDNLTEISALVKRLGYITSQLKGFARRSDDAGTPVSVRQAFGQTMLQLRSGKDSARLRVTEHWPEHDVIVYCSGIGLEQVFSNLLSNAQETLPPSEPVCISLWVAQHGETVTLSISDNGPGIPAGCMDKIFDPFYTTKERGLGLGLSISAGIIRAAGGSISVRNNTAGEGGGALFVIKLKSGNQDG